MQFDITTPKPEWFNAPSCIADGTREAVYFPHFETRLTRQCHKIRSRFSPRLEVGRRIGIVHRYIHTYIHYKVKSGKVGKKRHAESQSQTLKSSAFSWPYSQLLVLEVMHAYTVILYPIFCSYFVRMILLCIDCIRKPSTLRIKAHYSSFWRGPSITQGFTDP